MQRKQTIFASIVPLVTCAFLALFASQAQAQDKKADPAGTWTWSTPGRDGGEPRKSTLKLKVEGEKLTGTLTTPGRGQDAQPVDTEITEGKVKGDEISFSVVREFNGNKRTSKYTGKVTADTIKGKIESERQGETQTREWEAKREAAKK
jgi:hypothetical protein